MRLTIPVALLALALPAQTQWEEVEEIAPPWVGNYKELALEGDTLVVGITDVFAAYPYAGTALVYERAAPGGGFSGVPLQLVPSGTNDNDSFGTSLSLDGDTLAIGATGNDQGAKIEESNGLAFDPTSGTLYGVEVFAIAGSNDSYLLTVDPVTGWGTRLPGSLGFDVQGLAFDPLSGTLYGVDVDTDQLLVIDPVAVSATAVGPLGYGTVGGLAFDPNAGVLYATDHFTDLLLTVDRATGAASPVGALVAAFNLGGLAFDPDTNTLYGANYHLGVYTIDTATGAATALGPATGARALAFDSLADELYGSGEDLLSIDTVSGTGQVVGSIYSYKDRMGAVYVFERDHGAPGAWGESAVLFAPDPDDKDFFGEAVALAGDEMLVGMSQLDLTKTGRAFVYHRDLGGPDAWGVAAELTPSPISALDGFGMQAALEGNTAIVAAPNDDVLGANTGSVFVFERDSGGPGAWGQVAYLLASDAAAGDRFGWSVALAGDLLVIGAIQDDGEADEAGAAYVFRRDQGGWREVQKLVSPSPHDFAYFGSSAVISHGQVLVGARNDSNGLLWGGAVYAFAASTGAGEPFDLVQRLFPQNLAAYDIFGYSLATDGCELVGLAEGRDAVFRFELPTVATYCTAGVSANGCEARISATGTPSTSAPSGFVLRANDVDGQKSGLFFHGTAGRSALPWGNGTSVRCTPAPVFRGALLAGSGSNGQCDGTFAYDLTARWTAKPAQNPGPGALTQAQFWYRDPLNTSNQATSLSDAVEFCVGP
jgi:hypothetical protein